MLSVLRSDLAAPPLSCAPQEDAAVKARQAERLAGLAADQEQARIAAAQRSRIEAEVDARVKLWSRGKGIRQLLASLHTILTSRSVPDYVAGGASASSNADELKKTCECYVG